MVIVAASSIGAKEYPDSVVLEEVEVSAAAQRNLKSPELGRISLSGDKMLRLPVMFGEPDFSYDFVYQQLARQINAVTPGWQPDADPLPFSDSGINGTTHTIVIKEIIQGVFGMKYTLHEAKTMRRSFNLYAISKSYYNYLVDLLAFSSVLDDFHSGMIDIGISEPARIYSNVDGGTGIMASFNRTSKVIDVFDYTGPFPDLSDRWKDPWDEDW